MKYHELKTKKPSRSQQVGRGISAGRGKTAGRGTKGQGARKSGGVRPGFEGGQIPLYMRLPKLRGFKSRKALTETVYSGQLDKIKKSSIDNYVLYEEGLIASPNSRVKLILKGEISSKKDVKLQAASSSVIESLEKSGGSFSSVAQIGRTAQKPKTAKTSEV